MAYDCQAYDCQWQHWGSRFYSQFGEDIIVLNIFYRLWIEKPSYLDLGAHHPHNISNTALLYDRGCRGINVEPNPLLIEPFHRLRPEDTNLCMGIGTKKGTMPFWRYDNVWSGKNSFVKELAEENGPVTAIDVPVDTVDNIVRDHAKGVFPDFLSVDVEGMDFDIIKSIDYSTTNTPKVICVEMFSGGRGQMDDTQKIKNWLNLHYFLLIQVGANGIFVRRDYASHIY